MSFSVIITAGGIGKRMGSEIPKQFIEIGGLPILMHTITCFYKFDSNCQIILTLPKEWENFWKELILKHTFNISHTIVSGVIERYDSIKNALSICENEIVAVHDGVRPLVSQDTICRCLSLVSETGSAIPTLILKESIRKIVGKLTESSERKDFLTVQTPQFFLFDMLKNAYKIPFHSAITDDASLVEEAGYKISVCAGNEENIKITTPFDLRIAETFLV